MANTAAGARLWIGGTDPIDYTTEETALADFEAVFEASPSPPEVGSITTFGQIGPEANIVTSPTLSDKFVPKAKGTRNAGDPAVVVNRSPDDEGQVAMRDAEKTNYYYNFKLELADAVDENHTNTIIYFRALVASARLNVGQNEDFITDAFSLGVYPQPIIVESAPTSP